MKQPLFFVLAFGLALMTAPVSTVRADTTNSAPNPAAPGTAGAQGERGERLKTALEELNLTDAQKEQIKQIRANTSPGKDRRQQIMAVLTPEQKEKLKAMIEQYRSEQDGAAAPSAN